MSRLAIALLILAACDEAVVPETAPADVVPRHATRATIPDGPVRGTVAGTSFEARSAWYRVHRQLGREHLDIMLSNEAAECDEVTSSSVFIRFPDAQEPSPGELRRAPGDAGWSVHYQRKSDGRWTGNARAAALLVIDTVKRGSLVEGDVSACFADAQRSCVAGHFHAERCLDPVWPDVRDLWPE